MKIPYGASRIALTVALAGLTAQWAPAQSGVITNQTYVLSGGSGSHCYLIASLPANNAGDYDHLHLMVTTNYGWGASANASIDALFGNRSGFTYSYSLRGASVSADARLVAYMNSDSSISLYLMFANVYAVASYTVLEDVEETVYTSPSDLGSATPSGTLVFDSSSPSYAPAIFQAFGNNVGLGTTSPGAQLEIQPAVDGATQLRLDQQNWPHGFGFTVKDDGNLYIDRGGSQIMAMQWGGNVGIGTTSPVGMLSVGSSSQFQVSSAGAVTTPSITFADNTTQTTAFATTLCGGDYAESVDVGGSRTNYEPGDVLVIDPSSPGKFLKASEAYSTLVAGIYSTKPTITGRRQTTDAKTSTTEVPMAMVGIVPTKVTAENGPIKTGDLLVASSTLGHAMKGTDRSLLTGAVIGKALGSLESGTGVIEVLVTLQ